MNPASSSPRRAIEVYPHPATIALFGLEKTLKYKKGTFEARQHELLQLMTLIEGLDKATPRLRVNHNVSWVELRNGSRPRLDRHNSTETKIPSTRWCAHTSRCFGITGRKT